MPNANSKQFFFGILLISLATLLLELSLTRVLSVALWYHFGFLVISMALLGFGTSGVVLSLWKSLRETPHAGRALALLSLSFGASTIICFWIMQHIPFDPFSLLSDRKQLMLMPLYYIVVALPFFFSGLTISFLLTRGSDAVNKLYAFDLLGAGLGCVALVVVMPSFGGSGSVMIAAVLGMMAAAVFSFREAKIISFVAAILAIVILVGAPLADKIIPISVTQNKFQNQSAPVFSKWNTFSKIDVYDYPADSTNPGERDFVIDAGTALTGILDLRPDIRDYLRKDTLDRDYESGLAYLGKKNPKILVIGSGAGGQVVDGLHFGASSITAVEINPIINNVAGNLMNDYWGNLFHQPQVHLVTDEGRSFIRRSKDIYDAIVSTHTISNAAMASGAMSLSENYILTKEAFEDYYDHLTGDGIIYFTRPEIQIPRLFATGRELLNEKGIQNVQDHFFSYRNIPSANFEKRFGARPSFFAVFMMKKTPFTRQETDSLVAFVNHLTPPESKNPANEVLYQPYASPDNIYRQILTTPDLPAFYKQQTFELDPATDNEPFFNHHTRWSKLSLSDFKDVFTQNKMGRMALEDRPVAEITLIMILVQAVLLAAFFILFPLYRFSKQGLKIPGRWRYLGYFAGLGLGFIMIEITLLQRFTLFLGEPVYTLAVVLACLLLFTGAGSYIADRFKLHPVKSLRWIIPSVLFILLLLSLMTPIIFNASLGLDLPLRILISAVLIAPLGIVLGMPFPTGLRLVATEATSLIPWAWGVNGFFTVIGSVIALMLGMAWGFNFVLVIAALCYLVAWMAFFFNPTR